MKRMRIRLKGLLGVAAAVAVGCGLVSCEGLSVSLGSDGKFVVSGSLPKEKKVVDGKGK